MSCSVAKCSLCKSQWFSFTQRCSKPWAPRAARVHRTCRAGDDSGEKRGIDWDKEWRKATKSIPKVESSTRRSAPRTRQDQIRAQESILLDVFSQEAFFKVAGGVVLAILFLFIFVIGPPSGPPSSS